jgi:hypothetical protein
MSGSLSPVSRLAKREPASNDTDGPGRWKLFAIDSDSLLSGPGAVNRPADGGV